MMQMMMKHAGKSGTTNIAANDAPGGLFDNFFSPLITPPPPIHLKCNGLVNISTDLILHPARREATISFTLPSCQGAMCVQNT